MKEIGLDLNFRGITSILGNCYVEKGMELVTAANPLNYEEQTEVKPKRMTKEMAMKFMGMSVSK